MSELDLRNPWVFTTVNAVVWATVWGGVQFALFGDGVFVAAVQAGLAGVVFSAMYLYFA